MPDLARTLFAPILLVQGKRMFSRMPRLDPPTGATSGTTGDGPPLALMVTGDSAAFGYGVDTQDDALLGQLVAGFSETHRVTWTLHARFGSTIPKTVAWLARQEPSPHDVVVVSVGLNDIIAGAPLAEWLGGYDALAAVLRERFTPGQIVVSGLPPIGEFPALPQPMRWVIGRQRDRHDAALRAWASRQPDAVYVPTGASETGPMSRAETSVVQVMSRDGFHPGPRVYAEWARRIVEAVRLGREAG